MISALFHTIGNHDLYSMPREKVCQLINQKVNHSIDLDQVKLIFWETAREMDTEVYSGIVTDDQLTWLQKESKSQEIKRSFCLATILFTIRLSVLIIKIYRLIQK